MIHGDLDDRAGAPVVLTIPGLNNSGADHWQTLWERERGDCQRVELGMWADPRRNPWVTKLDHAIASARPPVILVAHSLGCLAVAWWAALSGQPYGAPVAGALLVAPPDVDGCGGRALGDFAPTPRHALPFPSYLVASRNDPYAAFQRSRDMASFWGSTLIDAGDLGHLNSESGLGNWPEGQALLDGLIEGRLRPSAGRNIPREGQLAPAKAILHSLYTQ
ncbi:RBBP9/YdeN family alpha/beta hydrolase [Sphingomonas sp. ID0503]|uniref:RBBP9/YdeN family alpha/beta hydrolase n=1 Tax=Sphingomonas sp. ID0503 TaxID=3399691 RepID=UPI003AFABCE0